ncbi:MAG: hypothetical protein HYU99_06335 [Deltaproteobacteria bacterium]|nr:hypothetical protein [Deltaproteobacteria bacterium]
MKLRGRQGRGVFQTGWLCLVAWAGLSCADPLYSDEPYSYQSESWRCPDEAVSLNQELVSAFGNVTIQDVSDTSFVEPGEQVYFRYLLGADQYWNWGGGEEDAIIYSFYEYYYLVLSTGDVLVLKFEYEYPFSAAEDPLTGIYYLFDASNAADLETLNATLAGEQADTYHSFIWERALSDDYYGESDEFSMSVTAAGEGVYHLETTIDLHNLTGIDEAGFYTIGFDRTIGTENIQGGYLDAYLLSLYDSEANPDSWQELYLNDVFIGVSDGSETWGEYDDYCGPGGGNIVNPVVLEPDEDI